MSASDEAGVAGHRNGIQLPGVGQSSKTMAIPFGCIQLRLTRPVAHCGLCNTPIVPLMHVVSPAPFPSKRRTEAVDNVDHWPTRGHEWLIWASFADELEAVEEICDGSLINICCSFAVGMCADKVATADGCREFSWRLMDPGRNSRIARLHNSSTYYNVIMLRQKRPLYVRDPRRRRIGMSLTKENLAKVRTLCVAGVVILGLGGCATYKEEFATINSRLDSLDQKVQSAAQSAESANQGAQQANQRLDALEGRVQQLEAAPSRKPRG